MVISQIRSLYRDENDLLRTVIKRIYEEWDSDQEHWNLKKVAFIFCDPDLPLPSERRGISAEYRHGWIIPPAWEFVSEVYEYERKPESEITYNHESEVGIIR